MIPLRKEDEGKVGTIRGEYISNQFKNKKVILINAESRRFKLATDDDFSRYLIGKNHWFEREMNRNNANS